MTQKPRFVVITLFPELFHNGPLQVSLMKKAQKEGRWHLRTVDLRQYGIGRHQTVDGTVYGGGAGMVLRADCVHDALCDAVSSLSNPRIVYMSPRGVPVSQNLLLEWKRQSRDMVILCGRYEGVDQRVLDHWEIEEVSLGDFVVCGGETPALLLLEGYCRLLEHVVGNAESLVCESFHKNLLEYPQYTKPQKWMDREVPEVLLSGHHEKIAHWRLQQSMDLTKKRRPDLWKKHITHDRMGEVEDFYGRKDEGAS